MLASTTLDRGNFLWPLTAERSWRELARRDCTALRIVSGGQETGRSRQGDKESRLFGIGVDSAKGFRGRWGVVLEEDEIKSTAEYLLGFASFILWSSIQLFLLHHLFSFLCPSVSSLLRFFFIAQSLLSTLFYTLLPCPLDLPLHLWP